MSAFVQRSGTQLTLNGQPWIFTGFNMPYLMHSAEGNSYLATALAAIGSNPGVVRVFCFQTYNIVSGAIDFTQLDALLATFASANVRVILVLGNNINGGGLANDDGALKDLAWWQGNYSSTVQSTSVPAQVVTYRSWVSQVVTRYANNPTILMWQLLNEAQAINDDGTGSELSAYNAMVAFVNDVGAMVKSIDSNHLLSLGNILGFNGGPSGQQWTGSSTFSLPPTTPAAGSEDYQLLLTNQYLDVGDYHDYGFATLPMGIGSVGTVVSLPGALKIGTTVGKPIMVGECGINWLSSSTINPPISPNTTTMRSTLLSYKLRAMFEMGVVGICLWSWRNNPQSSDGSDYGLEVGPSDPLLPLMATAPYASQSRFVGSSHNRLI